MRRARTRTTRVRDASRDEVTLRQAARVTRGDDGVMCPRCGDEFEDGVLVCPDDLVPLVANDDAEGATPVLVADRVLGRFAPGPGTLVVGMLQHRRHVHTAEADDEGVVVVRVDETVRDDLRAELVTKWPELLGALPPDERIALGRSGIGRSRMPGWADPPADAWVDWEGRLRVVDDDEDRYDDATRIVGPSLAGLGVILVVFGLYADASAFVLVLGAIAAVTGVFIPR